MSAANVSSRVADGRYRLRPAWTKPSCGDLAGVLGIPGSGSRVKVVTLHIVRGRGPPSAKELFPLEKFKCFKLTSIMSKNGMLNAKDMLYYSESYDEEGDEDIWDDRKLNDAYDKALRIANAEVAKRVAMSTNTQHKNKEGNNENKKEKVLNKTKSNKKCVNTQWKAGMPCRAMYEVDGQEYEAFVLRIINENECVVRFLGYENSEIVSISSLKQSLGKEERNRQIELALDDKTDEAYTSQSPNTEKMDYSDRALSPGSTEKSFIRNKKATKKKKNVNSSTLNGFDLPGMPFPMPNMAALRNQLGSSETPLAPPPLLGMDGEDQALSSMLLSWYMSGYYTGLYQGMKRAKQGRRHM
ncbi:hypothetical protein evm_010547 [Chilo suppressalis]|nr:hypothetical protein evm_010547 [Chilo suppressalis]